MTSKAVALHLSLFIVVTAPLALAAFRPLSVAIYGVLALLALSFHIIDCKHNERPVKLHWYGLPLFLGLFFALSMLIPLPEMVLHSLSPQIADALAHIRHVLAPYAHVTVLPVLSVDPPETAMRVVQLIVAVCIFVVLSSRARHRSTQIQIFMWILGGGFLLFFVSVMHRILDMHAIWGEYGTNETLLFAPMINPNHLARCFALFSLLNLAGALHTSEKLLKFFHGLCAVLLGAAVFLTLSRGGILVFVAALFAVWLFNWSKAPKQSIALAALGCLAITIAIFAAGQSIFSELLTLQNDLHGHNKFELYPPAISVIKDYWAWGTSPGALRNVFFSHVDPFPGMPPILTAGYEIPYVENIILQTLTDHGVIKGAALLLSAVWVAWLICRRSFRSPIQRVLAIAIGFICVADLLDFSLETGAILWLSALILALLAATSFSAGKAIKIRPSPAFPLVLAFAVLFCSYLSINYNRPLYERTRHPEIALAKHPFDSYYALLLAQLSRFRNQPEKALEWATFATSLRPSYALAQIEVARAQWHFKRYDKALLAYQIAFTSDPNEGDHIMQEVAQLTPRQSLRLLVLPSIAAEYYARACEQLVREHRLKQALSCLTHVTRFADATTDNFERAAEIAIQVGDGRRALTFIKDKDGNAAALTARANALIYGEKNVLILSVGWLQHLNDPCYLLEWQFKTGLAVHEMSIAKQSLDALKQCSAEFIGPSGIEQMEAKFFYANNEPAKAFVIVKRIAEMYPKDQGLQEWLKRLEQSVLPSPEINDIDALR